MKARVLITVAINLILGVTGLAQVNHLEKRISIEFKATKLKTVMAELEVKGGFYFSFDSELISQDSIVDVHFENEKVKVILAEILPSKLKVKSVGNHIVIYKPLPEKKKEVIISGYITDGLSSKPLVNATIYEPGQNLMASTDANGYYQMTVSGNAEKIGITASKNGYRQQVVYVDPNQEGQVDFGLLVEEKPMDNIEAKPLEYPDVNDRALVKLVVPQRVIESSENLSLFEKTGVQFSFIPGVSTSGLLNGNSTNNLSINILAGYSQATNGVEVGGLLNIDRYHVNGVQIAGIGNFTGRFVRGVQVASIFNYNGYVCEGAQVSAFSNINGNDLKGWQISAFSNLNNGKIYGGQVTSFSNVALKEIEGVQISAFSNVAISEISSLQLSGFTNYAGTNGGVQLSSFFNYAHSNKGVMMSFLNYADTSSGIPLGFMSIVRRGYHVMEISGTETFPINLAFRTGVNLFYNIVEVGAGSNAFKATYGFGTMPSIGRKLDLSMDLTASAVVYNHNPDWNYLPYVARFDMMLNIQASKKFAFAIGPNISYYVQPLSTEGKVRKLSFYQFYEHTSDSWYQQAWVGGKLALRFF